MIFNLGLYGVLGFKRMLAALREKDYLKASKEMLDSKWAKQVGYRAKKLASIMALGK
jgi:lysozyme